MILVVGTVTVPESAFDSALPAMKAMVEATRQEDGCIRYAFARDLTDPSVMHVSEAWRDRDALAAHGKTPHMDTWRAAIAGVGVIARDLRVYETDEGTPI